MAAGRVALGTAILLAPERVTGAWLGPANAAQPLVSALARMLAVRDLGLGLATLGALGDPVLGPRVVTVAAFADTVDAVATYGARSVLPRSGVWGGVAVAGGSAVAGFYMARALA